MSDQSAKAPSVKPSSDAKQSSEKDLNDHIKRIHWTILLITLVLTLVVMSHVYLVISGVMAGTIFNEDNVRANAFSAAIIALLVTMLVHQVLRHKELVVKESQASSHS